MPAITVENVSKKYRKGQFGYRTLREDLYNLTGQLIHLRRGNRRSYGERYMWALKDVSFQVEKGERLGIIGANGSGKTTLLRLLAGITNPTEGKISLKGRMGVLIELMAGFHPELTGRENIFLNGAIMGLTRKEIRRKFDEIVAFADIEGWIDTPIKRYSSGMHVRLGFAVSTHLDPEILLIDEVLAVGDVAFQQKCLRKMRDAAEAGQTVVFVSHNMVAVQRFCERVLLLEQGRIVLSGDPVTVVDAYHSSAAKKGDVGVEIRHVPDGKVGFVGWRVDGPSGDPYSCHTGEPCSIRLQLMARRIVEHAHFGVAVWSSDGSLVWAMRSLDHGGQTVVLRDGVYELDFAIPQFPLRPGTYQILASANDASEGTLDAWYAEPRLRILPKGESGLPPQWQGVLNISGQFSISVISNDLMDSR